jgi:hypothetical protein
VVPPSIALPEASVDVAGLDESDLVERNSDGGEPPRSVRPPPPPPPDAPIAAVVEEKIEAAPADPDRVIGAKPAAFCYWLFDLVGALPGDGFDDIFPGSGGVGRAWERYASVGSSRDG